MERRPHLPPQIIPIPLQHSGPRPFSMDRWRRCALPGATGAPRPRPRRAIGTTRLQTTKFTPCRAPGIRRISITTLSGTQMNGCDQVSTRAAPTSAWTTTAKKMMTTTCTLAIATPIVTRSLRSTFHIRSLKIELEDEKPRYGDLVCRRRFESRLRVHRVAQDRGREGGKSANPSLRLLQRPNDDTGCSDAL